MLKKKKKRTSRCFRRQSTGLTLNIQIGLLVRMMNRSTLFAFSVAQMMGRVKSVQPSGTWGIEIHDDDTETVCNHDKMVLDLRRPRPMAFPGYVAVPDKFIEKVLVRHSDVRR